MHIPSPANSYNFLQLFIAHSRFWLTISIRFFLLKRSNAFSNRLVVCWYFLSHLRFSREHTFSKYNPVLNTIQTRNLHENVGEIFWEENLTLFLLNKYKYLQMSEQGRRKVWKSGGGACSTVVGIICPPGWDRVNCFAKNWGGGKPPSPPLATALQSKSHKKRIRCFFTQDNHY